MKDQSHSLLQAMKDLFSGPRTGAKGSRRFRYTREGYFDKATRASARNLRHGATAMDVKVTPRQPEAFPSRVSRQIERIRARRDAENIESTQKDLKRRMAGNDRLHRQAAREKSGFYEGTTPLANILGQHFGRMRRQVEDEGLVRLV